MIASWFGQTGIVEQLLLDGGDIDARSSRYVTALNIAAFRKEKDITRMLVQSNGKVYIRCKGHNILQVRRYPRLR